MSAVPRFQVDSPVTSRYSGYEKRGDISNLVSSKYGVQGATQATKYTFCVCTPTTLLVSIQVVKCTGLISTGTSHSSTNSSIAEREFVLEKRMKKQIKNVFIL